MEGFRYSVSYWMDYKNTCNILSINIKYKYSGAIAQQDRATDS